MVHYRGGRAAIDPSVYPDLDAFWADLTAAYRDEVRRLGELGCTYLQFDDTSLAYMNDPHQREYIASIGGDPERQHVEYIRHINEALAERPGGHGGDDAHVPRQLPLVLGRGGRATTSSPRRCSTSSRSTGSSWSGTTSAPAASSRCASCRRAKQVVLGLVTTKRGELEQKDELKRRIEEAAQLRRRSSSSACRRSAASPRRSRATRSPRTSSGEAAPRRRGRRGGLGLGARGPSRAGVSPPVALGQE